MLLMLVATVVSSSATLAQQDQPVVARIRFDGATRTTEAYMLSLIRSRPGGPFRQDVVDADALRLLRTGKFLSVTSDTQAGPEGTTIIFRVVERPTVHTIRFEGNHVIKDRALADKVPIEPGDPFDAFSVREGRDNILAAYRDKGYGYAAVEVDQARARSSGELIYVIEEGPTVRVRQVWFEGNQAIDAKQLKKQVRTKPTLWIFRTGVFDPDSVEADAADLQRFYRGEGFLDARVSYRVEPGAEPGDLRVVFTIVEGEPYLVESIRIEGAAVLSDQEILGMMKTQPEGVIKQADLDADVEAVQTAYGEQGHIYSIVQAGRVFSTTPGYVIITIGISEGERVEVGRIVVRGNENTQDKVVRRALDLFPGDTFNLSLARAAEDRLRATRIFDRVSVTPVGSGPGVRDILLFVNETESTNDLVFGMGVTSNSGLVGSILLDIKNFDIFDTPRTFSELIKFRAFRGAGQRLRLELQPGTELNRFRIDFTEPYLFDKPLRFDLSLYLFSRAREGYDEQRTGSSVSLGKRLIDGLGPRSWFKDWYGELSFRAENVDVDNADIFTDKSIREVRGSTVLTSVRGTLVRDRTDNRFLPTRGDRWTMSYEQFLGDFNFGKLRANYARHLTLSTDRQGRNSVLSLRTSAGIILGDSPVFENFYAGGLGSIRGFGFRGVGPRGGISDDPIGGEFLLTASAEYSFPLAGELLRGVVFTDMGTVEEKLELTSWRVSVGFGVRLTIELFGPVPIEIDIAAPLIRDADDEERIFSFFIGGTF